MPFKKIECLYLPKYELILNSHITYITNSLLPNNINIRKLLALPYQYDTNLSQRPFLSELSTHNEPSLSLKQVAAARGLQDCAYNCKIYAAKQMTYAPKKMFM